MNGETQRIVDGPYVAIDVETTGIEAGDGHRICEIALLRFLRGNVIDSLVSLVNPLRPISPGASAVNGITDLMVADAPLFVDLIPGILSFIDNDVLVFHNAPFDLSFLRAESRRTRRPRRGPRPRTRRPSRPGRPPAPRAVAPRRDRRRCRAPRS